MAQLPSDAITIQVQDAQTTLFTASEAGIDEFAIVSLHISRNTVNDVNVDVFIDDGGFGSPHFLVKNRTIDSDGYTLPAKVIPLNANDVVIARPSSGTGDFTVNLTIGKQG